MNRGFRDDVGVEAVAKIDRINVVTVCHARLARALCYAHVCPSFRAWHSSIAMRGEISEFPQLDVVDRGRNTHHSRSLYMIVKKTCKNRLTALISTANRYNHASPDIMTGFRYRVRTRFLLQSCCASSFHCALTVQLSYQAVLDRSSEKGSDFRGGW